MHVGIYVFFKLTMVTLWNMQILDIALCRYFYTIRYMNIYWLDIQMSIHNKYLEPYA
jgi:hypothetical protein